MAVNLSVIDDTIQILNTIISDVDNVPQVLVDNLLNNIYKMSYNIVLSNLKGVPLLTPQKKAIISQYMNERCILELTETKLSELEYKIYKILYIVRLIDTDSYSVLYKIL